MSDDWHSIGLKDLERIIAEELAKATPEEKALFCRTAVPPSKWQLSPWGDEGGGFWVVAALDDRVLWFNDIEDGFNISRFTSPGQIPSTEYFCNQDELPLAIRLLASDSHGTSGPLVSDDT
ncbi:MAG TPA: hypothetical protein VN962_04840 [Polyangia bacterium]|nr:hypothetical protein [Polyangia bacterium]